MKVAVAMSGGVDSAAAAYLLHRQGHDVFGITLSLWKYEGPSGQPHSCCRPEDIRDARRVALQVGIPHYTLDYEAAFKEAVVDRFAADYARGRTPSPCVQCNTFVKFGRLLEEVQSLGASALATGHYARIISTPRGLRLARALDSSKDQSYFLFELGQEQLSKLIFPLGEMSKQSVRETLRGAGLAICEKPESQEICFVGGGEYSSFLKNHYAIGDRPGPIVGPGGEVLGEHRGTHNFTIGQRRGLGVSGSRPYYVTKIDADTGAVHVGFKEETWGKRFVVDGVSWSGGRPNDGEFLVQIRSRHAASPARLTTEDDGKATVEFLAPQSAITPGQGAVFYDGDLLEGGGWIAKVM